MSGGEHTPGPWSNGIHHAVTQGGRTFAHVTAHALVPIAAVPLGVEGYGREEGEANARLIASAPALEAACQALLDSIIERQELGNVYALGKLHAAVDMAREALGKPS